MWVNHALQQLAIDDACGGWLGNKLAWCPAASDKLAVVHKDGRISIWQTTTKQLIGHLPQTETAQTTKISYAIDWSPDGSEIVRVDKQTGIQLWKDGQLQMPLAEHDTEFTVVKWSHDGRWLAIGDAEGKVHIWKADK